MRGGEVPYCTFRIGAVAAIAAAVTAAAVVAVCWSPVEGGRIWLGWGWGC